MSNENGNGNQHSNGNSPNGHISVNGHSNCNGQRRNGHVPASGERQPRKRQRAPRRRRPSPPTTSSGTACPASVTDKLGQHLDSSLVSQRRGRGNRNGQLPGGPHRHRPGQPHLRPFGGWGHEVVGDVTLRDLDQVNTQTGEVRRIRAYSATVKVTVPGAPPRTDVGFQPVAEETVEGHETAFKGAVTDALKRALRTFGAQFGNSPSTATWRAIRAAAPGDTLAPALRKTLLDLGVSAGLRRRAGPAGGAGPDGQGSG